MSNDTIGEERAGAIEAGSGDTIAEGPASETAAVPVKRWRSVKQMKRSKLYKQHIAPLFTPEWQAELAQKIVERIMPVYSADITKRVAMKTDPPASDKPKRDPVFMVQWPAENLRQYWLKRIATANAQRIATHGQLARIEIEINACNSMLDQLREMPKPNGHIKD